MWKLLIAFNLTDQSEAPIMMASLMWAEKSEKIILDNSLSNSFNPLRHLSQIYRQYQTLFLKFVNNWTNYMR